MDYNMYGDIKLGEATEHELSMILTYIKEKYHENSSKLYLKKIKTYEDDTKFVYYLSVPIKVGSLHDQSNGTIYVNPVVLRLCDFYFIDLYIPESIQLIAYHEHGFISNKEIEGCTYVPDVFVEPYLYEILPFVEDVAENEEDQMMYVKQFICGVNELLVLTG